MKIIEQLLYIQKISGFNSKKKYIESLVKNGEFDEGLEYTLRFLLDTNIVSGLSSKKLKKKVAGDFDLDFIETLKWLEENNTGSDRDIAVARCFINKHPEYSTVLEEIFAKKFKLGLTPKTMNKIIPNFIYHVEFMKAKNYMDRYELGKFDFQKEYVISEKLDGIRCVVIKKSDTDIKAYSRQGKEIKGLVEIIEAFKDECFTVGAYDGELLSTGDFETDELRFQNTCSIVNSKSDTKVGLEFVMFDNIEITGFYDGFSVAPYSLRFSNLFDKVKKYEESGGKCLTDTTHKEYFCIGEISHDLLMELVEQCDKDGKEGVMINDLSAPYKAGRVDGILKLKKNLVADVRVIGFEAGEGKHLGRLGALIVEFDYKGISNVCNIGTGFSDEEREDIWNNQDYYLGKIVEVKYQKITKAKDKDAYALGFASYNHRIREDKNETNI